ncbi:MAG: hypothetical protein ACLRR3_11975 [Eubacterium sp.]
MELKVVEIALVMAYQVAFMEALRSRSVQLIADLSTVCNLYVMGISLSILVAYLLYSTTNTTVVASFCRLQNYYGISWFIS